MFGPSNRKLLPVLQIERMTSNQHIVLKGELFFLTLGDLSSSLEVKALNASNLAAAKGLCILYDASRLYH
jgi:hypothetical protein